jgi:bleomycin hydrolase
MNVVRAKVIAKHNLSEFQFSLNYLFFWDQLEKANLFLQAIIDTRSKPMDDKTVEWLFKNPIGDGGQFTGVVDLVTKYGAVPQEVMPETNSSNNTSNMSRLLALKLREFGLTLRNMGEKNVKIDDLTKKKTEMLEIVYRMLVLNLGEPPATFTWTQKDANGKPVETKTYTPLSFYKEFVDVDMSNYVMLMNDPTRAYNKVYEIEYDRHVYDGRNWKYLNLPVEDIKKIAIASIKDSTMMYFSCDVGKFLNRETGFLDVNNYDYASLMGTSFNMDKKQRIQTFASGSSHAMTLCAVDIENDTPKKWLVENSWGATYGHKGFLIMTDEWFDEYMFRLVVDKKYIPADIQGLLEQKPILLPPWDPMFALEE